MSGSTRRVDARGLACPQPVIVAKKALDEGGFEFLDVLVDSPTALENVTRFATHSGHAVTGVEEASGVSTIRIRRSDAAVPATPSAQAAPVPAGVPTIPPAGAATLFISSATIGSGDDELGALLMKGFIATLLETSPLPRRIIFMNGGVKLAVEGSLSLDKLSALADRGVEVLSCGTCLDFYKIKGKLAVGRVTNMFEIAGFLLQGSVLSL